MSVEPLREFLKFPEPRFLLLCLVKHTMDICDSSSNSCFSSEGELDCDCAGVSFPRPEESPSLFSLKLTSFWQTKGDFSSPVREHRPEEWFAYRALSALPEEIKSSELLAFAERVGEGIAICRCEVCDGRVLTEGLFWSRAPFQSFDTTMFFGSCFVTFSAKLA